MQQFVFSQTFLDFVKDHSQDLILYIDPDYQDMSQCLSYIDMIVDVISEFFNVHKTTTLNLQSIECIPCKEDTTLNCYIVQHLCSATADEQLKIEEAKKELLLLNMEPPYGPPSVYFIYDNSCIGEDAGYTSRELWEKSISTLYCRRFLLNIDNAKLYSTTKEWINLTKNKISMRGLHEFVITCSYIDVIDTTCNAAQADFEFSTEEEASAVYDLLRDWKKEYFIEIFFDLNSEDDSNCGSLFLLYKKREEGRQSFLTVKIWKDQSDQLRVFVLEPNDHFKLFRNYLDGLSYVQKSIKEYANV